MPQVLGLGARPGVLASLRAPGAPLRRLSPDVGAQTRNETRAFVLRLA